MRRSISIYSVRLSVLLGLVAMPGCNPELGQYTPRVREYRSPVEFPQESQSPRTGSLWTHGQMGNFLFRDQRARQVGDLVTIQVDEQADATRGASTTLSRDSAMTNAITGFLGLVKYLQPGLAGADLLGGQATTDFSGAGNTSRTERLSATVPAMVKKVMPNGNLYVEGYRVILVNREENRFYISGIIRPADITDDNTVSSSRVAEAEIEFNGRGVISDKQGPGVLSRLIDQYNPF